MVIKITVGAEKCMEQVFSICLFSLSILLFYISAFNHNLSHWLFDLFHSRFRVLCPCHHLIDRNTEKLRLNPCDFRNARTPVRIRMAYRFFDHYKRRLRF